MPVSVKFTDRKTNQSVPIAEIDRLISIEFNKKPHPTEFSIEYETICIFGIGALMQAAEFEITRELFEEHFKRAYGKTHEPNEELDHMYRVLEKFLVTEYRFEAWR